MMTTEFDFEQLMSRAAANDTDAMYQLSLLYRDRNNASRSDRYLHKAAQAGHIQARFTLARRMVDEYQQHWNFEKAWKLIADIEPDSPANHWLKLKVGLWHGAVDGPAVADVAYSLASDIAEASVLMALLSEEKQQTEDTLAWLCNAAVLGDDFAGWALTRHYCDQKQLDHAAYWWRQTGSKASGLWQPLAHQLASITTEKSPRIETPGNHPEWSCISAQDCESLNKSPEVLLVPDFLGSFACSWLIWHSEPYLQPSLAYNPASGAMVRSTVRTSDSMTWLAGFVHIYLYRLEQRLAAAADLPVRQGESLGVLEYLPGQEYSPHYDGFDLQETGAKEMLKDGGQRIRTALIYLNRDFSGGETRFPKLDLTVNPRLGSLLLFDNVDADNNRDELSLHAGLPVTTGQKWLASKWYRANPTCYWNDFNPL